MNKRLSSIQNIKMTELGTSSIFEIGDSHLITPRSEAIAVQRERAIFLVNEFNFNDFSIFSVPIIQPDVEEEMETTINNEHPKIQVGDIEIFSVTSSSVVHLGSSDLLYADSRIKHIRHLLREKNNN